MEKSWKISGLLVAGILLGQSVAFGAEDPAKVFKVREQKVQTILQDSKLDTEKKKTLLVGEISSAFDYMELARRSLTRHWGKLTGAQKSEFTGTLRSLIERSILGRLKPRSDYSVEVDQANVKGSEAVLPATLASPDMASGDEVQVELKLHESPKKGWVIYDLVIDEVSLLSNYKDQFNKIINEQNFDSLLNQMKKKLAEEQQTL
ncbi:MAG: ABC transporter substrate-binding protein [Bdellovibrionota bacterium]